MNTIDKGSLIPKLAPYITTSDGKLGSAWEQS